MSFIATLAFHDTLVGTLLGSAVAFAVFAGRLPAALLITTLVAGAGGTALAGVAGLAPAQWVRRAPLVPLLAGV